MDTEMFNLARLLANDLRSQMKPNIQLYKTGNMRANVHIVAIEDDYIDVVIATDYASYTNTRGRMAGWVDSVVDRVCRAYCSNNNVENEAISGLISYK